MDTARIAVHTDDPSRIVVTVSGEIDLATRDHLHKSLHAAIAIAVPGHKTVIVDLSQTSLMDCTGLGVLVQGYQDARLAGICCHLTGATGIVHRVLDLTGVFELFSHDIQDPTITTNEQRASCPQSHRAPAAVTATRAPDLTPARRLQPLADG
jgi:anti-sigma B factor antagonist